MAVMAEFEGIDLSEIANEYARVSAEPASYGSGGSDKYVQLPVRDGFVLLRILPRKKGHEFKCATRIHTLSNPGSNAKKTCHCPRTLVKTDNGDRWQGDCIICKYYSDLWAKSEKMTGKDQEETQNKARDIKPVERYYFNVIVRSEKDKDGVVKKNVGPKIFSCGKTTYAKILRAMTGDPTAGEKALGDITHPINGRDFRVVKKVVKGGNGAEYPNYDNSKFEDVSPAGSPDELKAWLENLHDLSALRMLKTPEELKQALRVHCGMVKEGDNTDSELDEFRNAGKSSPSRASETVREELTVATVPSASQSKAEDDTPMADDDFMKELERI